MIKAWYWRSLPLEKRTGSEIFATLFRPTAAPAIATLLESPYPTPIDHPQLSRYSICAGAPRLVDGIPQMWTPEVGKVFPFLEKLLQQQVERNEGDKETRGQGDKENNQCPALPFTGGWLGWLGYDVAWEIEQLPHHKIDPLPFPIAFWYEPDCFAVLDHAQQILWLAASDASGLDRLEKKLEKRRSDEGDGEIEKITNVQCPMPYAPSPPLFLTSQADYETAVNQAKKYIQAGDIFQANLSLRFQASTSAAGWEIYQALQKINPSPFASYWQTPWGEVISCSPERLVMLQNRQAETRPIAGTRSRGVTLEQDIQLAQDLLSNTKERAEHIMLVDLERNDLGRVCEWGTVTVDELLTIERYSHVMHLVSNIKGTLKSECLRHGEAERTAIDLIRATFPGGTITGCPKVRCMEIIEELEPVRRSLFYGSCGYLDWRGHLDLNILIRTLLLAPASQQAGEETLIGYSALNTVWGQVGAGIVADSDPEKEWYESLHKAQAQLAALKMLNNQ
ncbi:MAG: anthranilate synthase component I [Nostoc sp. DedVER02]|uniref:anthranilate synthase component I n=1 Tax=unclassified Nostoc TaxID=2593658 RepID=UPI002AD1F45D|nr:MULTISPECIES: anthranilate synthase component I [unclassified Nostoc]MDZ7984779.1 anthranilate synthase component I [Nostoc sp. DedVER02]MDZ8115332.1 anthranilate synthase component I [Nostoc sp. DedVER01b]